VLQYARGEVGVDVDKKVQRAAPLTKRCSGTTLSLRSSSCSCAHFVTEVVAPCSQGVCTGRWRLAGRSKRREAVRQRWHAPSLCAAAGFTLDRGGGGCDCSGGWVGGLGEGGQDCLGGEAACQRLWDGWVPGHDCGCRHSKKFTLLCRWIGSFQSWMLYWRGELNTPWSIHRYFSGRY
jgi:hypothetical protein